MSAAISFNPQLTTVSAGLFNTQSVGLVQGTAYPDPAINYKRTSGVLASTETLPMWGGVGIYTNIPGVAGGPVEQLGPVVGRATTLANLVAFSVFDGAYGMINTPQSPVPLAATYMQVAYYRLGSGARIAVQCDPALATLIGDLTTTQVSWDFVTQRLILYVPAYVQQSVSSATYNTTTGILSLTFSTAPFGASIADGADGTYVNVSGLVGGAVNGNWPVVTTTTSGTIVELQVTKGLGSLSLTGGTLAAGGGALACQVLDIQTSNCQVVSYDSNTGFATWNFNGACAVILI